MKIINIREARAGLSELVADAQREPICLTRHGKPVALLAGVEGMDLETLVLESSPDFWAAIERSRKDPRPRVRIEEVRKRLGLPAAKKGR